MIPLNNVALVKRALRTHPDGLTMAELVEASGLNYNRVHYALQHVRSSYIDRWVPDARTCKWMPVYCIEEDTPPDSPKPDILVKKYLESRGEAHV